MAKGRPRAFDACTALDDAMEVFWRQGYDGASIADLTAAMGISAPSLYAAFGNKEGLFRAVLERYDEEQAGIRQRMLDAPTSREAVAMFLKDVAEKATKPGEPPGCLLLQGGLAVSEEAADIPQELARCRASAEMVLRTRIECGAASGELAEGADPAALARYVTAVSNGMCVQAAAGATRAELLQTAELALAVWPTRAAPAKRAKRANRKAA